MPASEEFSGKPANSVAAPAAQFEGGQSGRAGETGEDDSSTQDQDADQVRRARAEAVAKLIEELNVCEPQMFEDEKEYNLLQTKYPDFLTFKIAKDRPDLRMKVQCIRESSRHIRLAQELAGALYGLSGETVADAWKDHKPVRYKRLQAPGKTSKRHTVRPKR